MTVLKSNGRVIGGSMTVAEKKALDIEIRKELKEYNIRNLREIDALILWELHTQLGFGKDRLLRFYRNSRKAFSDLQKRFDFTGEEGIWLCTTLLKNKFDIDLEQLENEEIG